MNAVNDTREGNATTLRRLMEAFRERRLADADALLAANYSFTSQYDDHIDRASFFERCWPQGDVFSQMSIERITGDADGAFVTYFVTTKEGKQFRNTEYATISNGQIQSTFVYFGPNYQSNQQIVKSPER